MKIHASPIVCIECGKKFKRPFELKRHEDEVHKNLRTFDCEVCGKSFPRKSSLKSHQQNVHEKEDKCSHRNLCTPNIHNNEKQYKSYIKNKTLLALFNTIAHFYSDVIQSVSIRKNVELYVI